MFGYLRAAAFAAGVLGATSALAVDLTVTHFGTGMYGVPFAIAREKGWFKSEAGLDVTGFITSAGGGTTIRNALASDIPYGEVALPAAIAAIQQGVKLTIVHGGVLSVADQVWITRKDDTSIKQFADLKGKKLGYSSPKSVTDIITSVMLQTNGLTSAVERKSVGGIGSGLTALREGGVDMTYVTEPVWSKEKGNFRPAWVVHPTLPRGSRERSESCARTTCSSTLTSSRASSSPAVKRWSSSRPTRRKPRPSWPGNTRFRRNRPRPRSKA